MSGLPLSALDTEEGVRSLFGEPYWRDEDEDEVILAAPRRGGMVTPAA